MLQIESISYNNDYILNIPKKIKGENTSHNTNKFHTVPTLHHLLAKDIPKLYQTYTKDMSTSYSVRVCPAKRRQPTGSPERKNSRLRVAKN